MEDIDAENVDFQMLTQIVHEGKLTCILFIIGIVDEAIVLIVRERALLINEKDDKINKESSFISKFSMDNFLQENNVNNVFNLNDELIEDNLFDK